MHPEVAMRRLLLSLLAVALLSGCSKSGVSDVTPYSSGARSYLDVKNHFALPVEIIISGHGTTMRLGTVHPGMSAQYTIPRTFGNGQTITFTADAGPGQFPYHSADILVQPGMIVDMEVASVLFNSTAVIRPGS
jgi:hypothetical protein